MSSENELDLSIVMPCLNEEKTIGACISEAKRFISSHGLNAEIIISDNGSTDNSADIAKELGAAVISEPRRGYGRAIRTGIEHSRGKVIIFGDCDTTYDFFHLDGFYFPLERGEYDVMIGDRFRGGIEKGAMSALHRLGVPFLSWCGRVKFRTDVRDFHCGLRALTREAADKAHFRTDGMEFATEMIAECTGKGLRIGQTPTKLRKCSCKRASKLRTFPDGLRHLKYIIMSVF